VTTLDDDAAAEPDLWTAQPGSMTGLSVRQLVAELARAEDALRSRPDDPEPAAHLRLVVRELRRRRARFRLQAQLLGSEPRHGGSR
jgi:hypothetical protein